MEFAVFKAPLHYPIEREKERERERERRKREREEKEREDRDITDLVTFTEEILDGKLHFLSSDSWLEFFLHESTGIGH